MKKYRMLLTVIAALLVADALLLWSGLARAADHTVTWTPPTETTTGEAIGADDLLQYRLRCSTIKSGPYADQWIIEAPATSDTRDYPPGDYYCRLTVNNAVGWSKLSNEVFFSIALPAPLPSPQASPPNPPTNLTAAGS